MPDLRNRRLLPPTNLLGNAIPGTGRAGRPDARPGPGNGRPQLPPAGAVPPVIGRPTPGGDGRPRPNRPGGPGGGKHDRPQLPPDGGYVADGRPEPRPDRPVGDAGGGTRPPGSGLPSGAGYWRYNPATGRYELYRPDAGVPPVVERPTNRPDPGKPVAPPPLVDRPTPGGAGLPPAGEPSKRAVGAPMLPPSPSAGQPMARTTAGTPPPQQRSDEGGGAPLPPAGDGRERPGGGDDAGAGEGHETPNYAFDWATISSGLTAPASDERRWRDTYERYVREGNTPQDAYRRVQEMVRSNYRPTDMPENVWNQAPVFQNTWLAERNLQSAFGGNSQIASQLYRVQRAIEGSWWNPSGAEDAVFASLGEVSPEQADAMRRYVRAYAAQVAYQMRGVEGGRPVGDPGGGGARPRPPGGGGGGGVGGGTGGGTGGGGLPPNPPRPRPPGEPDLPPPPEAEVIVTPEFETEGARQRALRAQQAATQAGRTAAGLALAAGAFGSQRGAQAGLAQVQGQGIREGVMAGDAIVEADLDRQLKVAIENAGNNLQAQLAAYEGYFQARGLDIQEYLGQIDIYQTDVGARIQQQQMAMQAQQAELDRQLQAAMQANDLAARERIQAQMNALEQQRLQLDAQLRRAELELRLAMLQRNLDPYGHNGSGLDPATGLPQDQGWDFNFPWGGGGSGGGSGGGWIPR